MVKRTFDCLVAALALVLLFPLFLLVALFIKLDSTGPVLFRQERIGRGFRPFSIYKFRTMVADADRRGGPITYGNDPRITSLGRLLRRTKLDELPQLLNVLKGEMSIVGPRPEVRQYVEYLRQDFADILRVRPGITDFASLKFHDEAALLGASPDPDALYLHHILPQKVRLAKEYVGQSSLITDLTLIVRTLAVISGLKRIDAT